MAEPPQPAGGKLETACGGWVDWTPETPVVEFKGRTLAFCLEVCQQTYATDPDHSCLADRIKA